METEEMAMGGPDTMAMEVAAEETVRTSASATAIGGQAPPGVRTPLPLRASLPGDGQHWPPDATRANTVTQPTPAQALSRRRMELQQVEVRYPSEGKRQYYNNHLGCSFAHC